MIEGTFDLVFRGQTIKSIEVEEVKSNLVALFKSSPEAIDKLFTGEEVPVRRGLDYSTAMKYQSALKKAGALALIKEVENAPNETSQTQAPQGKATFGAVESHASAETADKSPVEASSTSPSNAETSTQETAAEPASADDSMTIAEAGAQLMPDKVYEKREVDTSELSLAATGERIMPEKAPDNTPPPSIDHLSLE